MNLIKLGQGKFVAECTKRFRGTPDVPLITDKNGKAWTAKELEKLFIKVIGDMIEQRYGRPLGAALMTVPANYTTLEREATINIANESGLKSISLINEPTGAALAYVEGKSGIFVIVDIGAGTIDVTILETVNGEKVTILATAGRNDLGGEELTTFLVQYVQQKAAEHGIVLNPETDTRDCGLLKLLCEEAKKELSTQNRTAIATTLKSKFFETEISRNMLEKLASPIARSNEELVRTMLERASIGPEQVDGVVFAGGGSLSPVVTSGIKAIFKEEQIRQDIDPLHCVAVGAFRALDKKIEERIAEGDVFLQANVDRMALPTSPVINEVTGKALGVRVFSQSRNSEVLGEVIPACSPVDAEYKATFDLKGCENNQVEATIAILEGEAFCAATDASVLAEYRMENLPAGPEKDRIEFTYQVDSNGLVNVTARDTVSGQTISESVQVG